MQQTYVFLQRWLPVVLWMAFIAALSSIPALQSGLPPLWDLVLRKFAHAAEYGALALLVLRAHGVPSGRGFLFSIAWSTLYAVTDELHQTAVPGRHGSVLDVLVDALGACIALGAVAVLRGRKWYKKGLTERPLSR